MNPNTNKPSSIGIDAIQAYFGAKGKSLMGATMKHLQSTKTALGDTLSKLGASTIEYRAAPPKTPSISHQDADTASWDSPAMQEASPYIKAAAERSGVAPALLASIYAQESSAGTSSKNYNKKIGESAYLLGLTENAKKDLLKAGKEVDFNSKQGVFNAAADYLALRSKEYAYDKKTNTQTVVKDYANDPQELYLSRYANATDRPIIEPAFKKRYEYYQQHVK